MMRKGSDEGIRWTISADGKHVSSLQLRSGPLVLS
jgi:hypothetical protein